MKLNQIKNWQEDLRYYDPENIELNTIVKLTDFKNKRVLDAGCGIARLTLPLSKYAKEIIAIDNNKEVIKYNEQKNKRRNINYIVSNIKDFDKTNFDIAILAQPRYIKFKENLKSINKALKNKGKLIIIRWIDKENYYNSILTPFWNKDKVLTRKVKAFSKEFSRILKSLFRIKKIKLIKTYCSYPNKEIVTKSIIQDCPKIFTKKDKTLLDQLLEK